MKIIAKTKIFKAAPEAVFDYLDDLGVTGMHMTTSSMPMMGGKMNLEFLSVNKTGLHTKYRWTGKVLWLVLDFTVVVTTWIRGKEKTWETIGHPKMILYSWFRMHLTLEPTADGSKAYLAISYKKPTGIFNRILSYFLADWYGRWCLHHMLQDTEKELDTRAVSTKPS